MLAASIFGIKKLSTHLLEHLYLLPGPRKIIYANLSFKVPTVGLPYSFLSVFIKVIKMYIEIWDLPYLGVKHLFVCLPVKTCKVYVIKILEIIKFL